MKSKTLFRSILSQTMRDLRAELLLWGLICAMVFVPVTIYNTMRGQAMASLASTFITYLLNLTGFLLAFRLASIKRLSLEKVNGFLSLTALKLPQFFAVSLVQLLSGTPFVIGFVLLLQALAIGAQAWWLWLISLASMGLAVYLTVRWSLAGVLVANEPITSIKALRQSFDLTKKRFFRTAGYLVFYFVLAILAGPFVFTMVDRLISLDENKLMNGLLSGLLLALLVPIYACYLTNMIINYRKRDNDSKKR